MNKLANEPIAVSTVVTIITWLATRFALDLDATTATALATVVFAVGQWLARRFSTPVAKAEQAVRQAYLADPAKDAIPQL